MKSQNLSTTEPHQILPLQPIKSFPLNEKLEFEFDNESEIASVIKGQLLDEILTEEDKLQKEITTSAHLKLSIEKKFSRENGEYFLLAGDLEVAYPASCVRCLKLFPLQATIQFDNAIINEERENDSMFADQLQIVVNEQAKDLYFYTNKKVSLVDSVLEKLHLEKVQFPLHEEECKGLCQQCGVDLNHSSCPHS